MRRDKETIPFAVVRIVAIGLLVWAYAKHPIGYYTLLRFVVCATCAYGAYCAMKLERTGWIWAMALVAVLFNPIFPIYLKKEHWEIIDAIIATFLLLSIPLLRPSQKVTEESKEGNKKSGEYRESIKTILWGVGWIIGAYWFWYSLVGNPFDELALIRRAQITVGTLVETYENEQEDFRGHVSLLDVGVYTYRLPDGREFKTITKAPIGQLKKHEEVEYLPDNPAVSRIKGDGSQSTGDWLWRKVGIGGILLAFFVSIGIGRLRDGVRNLRRARNHL